VLQGFFQTGNISVKICKKGLSNRGEMAMLPV